MITWAIHTRAVKRGPAAFTLIELLVVVAIITLLIGILLPALGRAKENGRRTQCLSNIHQMLVSSVSYTSCYSDSYPIAYYDGFTTVFTSYSWDFTITTDWSTTPQTVTVVPGILWDASGNNKVQQCPSFDGSANSAGDPYTGYNYNTSYIGHGAYETIPDPIRITQVGHPATTAIFGDGQYAAGANKYMRAPFPNPGDASFSGRYAGTQGFRHSGATNAGFCDGHAETLQARYTNISPASDHANIATGTGFLSADNSLYNPQ